jgi:hypothetical protein
MVMLMIFKPPSKLFSIVTIQMPIQCSYIGNRMDIMDRMGIIQVVHVVHVKIIQEIACFERFAWNIMRLLDRDMISITGSAA